MVIKIKDYKIKTSFINPDLHKARANNTGINFMIFMLIFVENFCNMMNDDIHNFLVWLGTGSNPSHTGKIYLINFNKMTCRLTDTP